MVVTKLLLAVSRREYHLAALGIANIEQKNSSVLRICHGRQKPANRDHVPGANLLPDRFNLPDRGSHPIGSASRNSRIPRDLEPMGPSPTGYRLKVNATRSCTPKVLALVNNSPATKPAAEPWCRAVARTRSSTWALAGGNWLS